MTVRYALLAFATVVAAGPAAAVDFSTAYPESTDWTDHPGFYLSLHGGAVFPENTQVEFEIFPPAEVSGNVGYRVGGALGYRFNDAFSLEGEVSFMSAGLKELMTSGTTFAASGRGSAVTGMANVLLHLPTDTIRPYVGAGVGGAWFWATDATHAGAGGDITNDGDAAFAWQLIAGIDFAMNNGAMIGARYRYFQADGIRLVSDGGVVQDNQVASHSAEVVLTLPLGNLN